MEGLWPLRWLQSFFGCEVVVWRLFFDILHMTTAPVNLIGAEDWA